jgi:hypothetical protein
MGLRPQTATIARLPPESGRPFPAGKGRFVSEQGSGRLPPGIRVQNQGHTRKPSSEVIPSYPPLYHLRLESSRPGTFFTHAVGLTALAHMAVEMRLPPCGGGMCG